MKQILISINRDIYDVTSYISKHPGEGIRSLYLRCYNGRESTEEFEKFHMTDEPDEILYKTKENMNDEKTGIHYVCPFFFKRKIPKYFIYLKDDPHAVEYMKDKNSNTFILRRSNSDLKNSLIVTYNNSENKINHLRIKKNDKGWNVKWKEKEINGQYVEDIIKEIFQKNNYNMAR